MADSKEIEAKHKALMAKYPEFDLGSQLQGTGQFKDTKRKSSGYGEAMDSSFFAPARVLVDEFLKGTIPAKTLGKVFAQIGADPELAPVGSDIISRYTDQPQLQKLLGMFIDFGASLPGVPHITPGVVGEIRGVKNLGKVADAVEAFAERGKSAPSTEARLNQIHGQTPKVADAIDPLIERSKIEYEAAKRHGVPLENVNETWRNGGSRWKSAYDNPRNAPPKVESPVGNSRILSRGELSKIDKRVDEINAHLEDPHLPEDVHNNLLRELDEHISVLEGSYANALKKEGKTAEPKPKVLGPPEKYIPPGEIKPREPQNPQAFWHDVNDHSFSDKAKEMMDSMLARGISEEHILKAHGDASHPYRPDPESKRFSALPNYGTKPTGVIGSPGFSPNSGPDMKEPFPWMDSKYGAGKELLEKHKSLGMPVEIHTSSDLIGRDDYKSLIPPGSRVNMYYGPLDVTEHRIKNPASPSNKRLKDAVDRLRDHGVDVNEIHEAGDGITPIKYSQGGVVKMAHGGTAQPMHSMPQHMPMLSEQEFNTLNNPPAGYTLDQAPQGPSDLPAGYELDEDKYGGPGGMLASAALGTASGLTLGGTNVLLTKSGLLKPETLKALQEVNPVSYGAGEVASIFAPSGAAALIGKGGKAIYGGLKALKVMQAADEIGGATKAIANIGAHALGSAAEGAAYAGTSQTLNEYALGDPDLNAEKILGHYGNGALLGGMFGAAIKTAAVGAPPALKAASEALTGLKNLVVGAGHGEESLVSGILNKISPPDAGLINGKLADAFMNRAKNLDIDEQSELVQKVTAGLNTVKKNLSTVLKHLNSDLRPEERDFLINNASVDPEKVINARRDVIFSMDAAIQKMREEGELYSPSTARELELERLSIVNGMEKETTPAQIMERLKTTRQNLQKMRFDKMTSSGKRSADLITDLGQSVRGVLHDPEIFGFAGAAEAAHNEMLTKIYSYIGPDGRANTPLQKEFKKLFLGVGGDFDAGKIKSLLKKVGPEGDRARSLLDEWFELQDSLPEHFENTYANIPNDRWDQAKLGGMLENAQKTGGDVGLAQTQYAQAIQNQKGKNLGLRELLIGGIGVSHPLIGAAAFAADVASRPIEYVNKLAEVERILGKATTGVGNAAKAVFIPTLKGVGKAKAPLLNQIMPKEEFKKMKDDLSEFNNNPSKMINALNDSTEHLRQVAPNMADSLQSSMITASKFLQGKLPNQNISPFEEDLGASPSEIASFQRYKNMVDNPIHALNEVRDGMINHETIETLSAVYPRLYQNMKQALMDEAMTKLSKKETIPYQLKQSISFFIGEPIDRSLHPQAIMANQAAFMPAQKPEDQMPKKANTQGKVTLAKRSGLNRGEMET